MAGQRERDPNAAASLAAVTPGASGGSWYTWWNGDPLPALPPLPGFTAERVDDARLIAQLVEVSAAEARALAQPGDCLYVARIETAPAGYGWSAAGDAEIGELRLSFTLAPRNRYLWGFVTRPVWRGRGIYPRLLQAILTAEAAEADRFWIGHEPGNVASARGILKAGFRRVGDLYFLPDGGLALLADGVPERAGPAAAVLGVRELGVRELAR